MHLESNLLLLPENESKKSPLLLVDLRVSLIQLAVLNFPNIRHQLVLLFNLTLTFQTTTVGQFEMSLELVNGFFIQIGWKIIRLHHVKWIFLVLWVLLIDQLVVQTLTFTRDLLFQ
jgi:hypothetical protein